VVRLRDLAFPCTGVVDWLLPNRLRRYDAIVGGKLEGLRNVKVGGWVAFSESRESS